MAELVLGPILRHVDHHGATVWVQTDAPCEVSIAGGKERTFEVEGHHFALVRISGLEPGEHRPYRVELDGEVVWPAGDYPFPAPAIRPLANGEHASLIFGSCRVALPHEPPYTLDKTEDSRGQGIDALRAMALRIMRSEERAPDCLLMLGDQIYSDDISPAMKEITSNRTSPASAPADELGDFDEYAKAYHETWSEPVIRWLLSTVPSAMIFDDHEVHAQWNISRDWQDMLESHDWYEQRISGAMVAYWIFQHIGNLSLDELEENKCFQQVREIDGDAGPFLREQMKQADKQPGHSRWSFYRDLGDSRLLVIDSRAGRVLDPPDRKMIHSDEWDWIVEHSRGDFDHLLLGSSLPFFLTPGLHHIEAWDSKLADRGKYRLTRWIGEKIRQKTVMDHWASFPDSFEEHCRLLGEIATGAIGDPTPPESIVMLSGDVHHCYLAEIELQGVSGVQSRIWQAVCSAYRKDLAKSEKRAMLIFNSAGGERFARRLARMAGVHASGAEWELVHEPTYDNQVGCLTFAPDKAEIKIETTVGSHWRDPQLSTVFEHDLLDSPPASADGRDLPRSPG